MFELILMRHAKSDWDNNLPDKDRPLNNRGIKDASRMGKHLVAKSLVPDTMLISAAERALQTARLMHDSFNLDDGQVHIVDELYLSSPTTMLEVIKHHASNNQRLMLVAHNPGIDELVMYLAATYPPLTTSGKLMVTCSAAVFQIESVEDLHRPGSAKLIALYRPKEIY